MLRKYTVKTKIIAEKMQPDPFLLKLLSGNTWHPLKKHSASKSIVCPTVLISNTINCSFKKYVGPLLCKVNDATLCLREPITLERKSSFFDRL